MDKITVATFYKFFDFPDFAAHRQEYKSLMQEHDIRGSILLADEGINATISGSKQAVDILLAHLRSDPRMSDLTHKESYFATHPFKRAKVRLKKEAVSLGKEVDISLNDGTYVGVDEWNRLLEDEEVTVIDTRNFYETHIGIFKNAIAFDIDNFRQLPAAIAAHLDPQKHRKIAMYCTGGIRCEKFACYMRAQGFDEVYQLKDGILKYLEVVPEEKSLWRGGCFVFDERVAVGHGLAVCEDITMCRSCGAALLPQGGCVFCAKKHSSEQKNLHPA